MLKPARGYKALLLLISLFLYAPLALAGSPGILVNTAADTVANNGLCSLREAITNANTDSALFNSAGECVAGSAGLDTINFLAAYTITLVGSQLPVVTSPISILGLGPASTIIQANAVPGFGTFRVFEVSSTGNLSLDKVTVRRGLGLPCIPCALGPTVGGGIFNNAGSLTVSSSTISENSAYDGGGIYNYTGTVTVSGSTLAGNGAFSGAGINNDAGMLTVTGSTLDTNSASFEGGGIANLNLGGATVSHSTFTGNSADHGGGVYNEDGVVNITRSTLASNSAASTGDPGGGGIFNAGGKLSLRDSTLSGNSSQYKGGGIYNLGTTSIIGSTLSSNTAPYEGGGLYDAGTSTVDNSTFSGNSVAFLGGGIFNAGGATIVTNSTFWANTSTSVGAPGASGISVGSPGTVTLKNSIVANSTANGDCGVSGGTITADNSNIDSDGSCGSAVQKTLVEIALGPLANNGGPTQTHALLAGSAAIDAGNNTFCATVPVSNLDQRGRKRPFGAACDVGAFEVTPALLFANYDEAGIPEAFYTAGGPCGFSCFAIEDNFNVNGGWTVSSLAFFITALPSVGNVASGWRWALFNAAGDEIVAPTSAVLTLTDTGQTSSSCCGTYSVYTVLMSGLNLNLPPGEYWFRFTHDSSQGVFPTLGTPSAQTIIPGLRQLTGSPSVDPLVSTTVTQRSENWAFQVYGVSTFIFGNGFEGN